MERTLSRMLTLKIRKVNRTRDGIKKASSPLSVGEASGDYFKLKLTVGVGEEQGRKRERRFLQRKRDSGSQRQGKIQVQSREGVALQLKTEQLVQ